MRISVWLMTFLCAYSLSAQDTIFHTGGYQLKGEVELLTPRKGHEEILFIVGENKRRIPAYEILSIHKDGEVYATVKYSDTYKLMREEISGHLTLYSFRFQDGADFGPEYLKRVSDVGREVPHFGFKAGVGDYLEDCPLIVKKIRDKTFTSKNLEEMVTFYNENCMENEPTTNTPYQLDERVATLISSLQDSQPDLKQLLTDIEKKIKASEPVPDYMLSALQGEGKPSEEIKELLRLIRQD